MKRKQFSACKEIISKNSFFNPTGQGKHLARFFPTKGFQKKRLALFSQNQPASSDGRVIL
jgi:hypothetical protein